MIRAIETKKVNQKAPGKKNWSIKMINEKQIKDNNILSPIALPTYRLVIVLFRAISRIKTGVEPKLTPMTKKPAKAEPKGK